MSSLQFFSPSFPHHFYTEKKYILKKKIVNPPTGHKYGNPLDRKQTFFKSGLIQLYNKMYPLLKSTLRKTCNNVAGINEAIKYDNTHVTRFLSDC